MYKFQIIPFYFQDVSKNFKSKNQKILISNIYNFLLDIYQESEYKAKNFAIQWGFIIHETRKFSSQNEIKTESLSPVTNINL